MTEDTIKELYASGRVQLENRTRAYLVPTMYEYGKEFVDKMRQFSSPACGICDWRWNAVDEPCLYFLLNIEKSSIRRFSYDMLYFRRLSQYIGDYPFGELLYSKLHMLVFRIPEKYHTAYQYFLDSKYSKMYNKEEAFKLFLYHPADNAAVKNRKRKVLQAVTRDEETRYMIANEYGVSPHFVQELDSLWKQEEETFNYEL